MPEQPSIEPRAPDAPDAPDAPAAQDDADAPSSRSWWADVKAALEGHPYDYTRGRLGRAILVLAIPMVLEMAMESVFAVCDVFFVAKLGDDAVATVGLTESMLTIVYAIAIGLSMSATAMVARRTGEKDPDGAVRAGTQAIAVGAVVGLVIGAPCAYFASDLLRLMSAPEAVIENGSGYASILLGSNVVILLLFLNNAVFRGAGDAALAMRALWIANGVNLVLDPCFIFGWGPFPELGVTGAAVATTCGRGIGVIYQFAMLRRGAGRVRLKGPAFRIDFKVMAVLLRLSAGGVAQFLIATASWVVLMRIVAPFGEAVLAGYTIAVRIVMFTILPAWGLCNAAATLVGQNLGARRPDRAERSVWLTGTFNMIFLGVVMLVFLAFGPRLIAIFTDRPETMAHGADALRIISYGYLFYAWGMVMVQAFNGAGDTMTPTWINLFCFWFGQIPLAWTLATVAGLGPHGVFWSIAGAEAILAIVSLLVFRRGRWKTISLATDGAAA